MKSIKTLIKLSKQKLDEKRRQLVELESQQNQLLEYSQKMKNELEKEQQFAADNPEMSMTFASYKISINERQANLQFALNDLRRQIDAATIEIAGLFGEMKKYEILLNQKIIAGIKEEKHKETLELDEIAMNSYLSESE